ncbi:MAG: Cna B-type domain-containing protein [Clostridium sp.]|uniref:Cna B-type domain-containing protein n=1 Tax=Clostridium sp. TaxID=1506 RepID=UPI002A753170|nr:Cna B-type domain-containing protein [Clostridium sp.]MDY2632469.1 Cna B-type domain-containing protein [Clostridium sp.]
MVRRFLSSILAVTLLASCITFSRNGSEVKAETTPTNNSNTQIIYQGEKNEVATDKVSTSKIINETEVENEFEITLQVTTEEDIKNISINPDAATVLVLDNSGSMSEKSGNTTRFKAMKDAAKSFLTKFAEVEVGSSAKRLVSIVSFASNVKNETYSDGENNWINVANTLNDLNNAISKIDKISNPNGGTNIEGALIMANNIVNDGKSKSILVSNNGELIRNINIILLTDGSPTFHMGSGANKSSIETLIGTRGGGDESYRSDWRPVGGVVNGLAANDINISKTIKDSGTNLYTIAFSTTSAKFYYGNNQYIRLNPSTWMSTFATRNFLANNASELTEQFEKINKLIALSAQAWKVTDPMGENIIYKGITGFDSENAKSYDSTNNTLTWDLKNSSPVESTTDAGNKKYTYTLKYKVALDTTDISKGVNYYKSVATNGETILDYYLFSKQGEDESLELKHANFKIPKVRGLFGNLEFTKVNEKKQPMSEVLFTLDGIATGSNKPVTRNIASDENGKIILSNIPAGIYTLTETSPSGYIGAGPWNVVVSYGNTTKDATLGDTIINYPASRNINVEKKWSGLPEGKPDLPEGVTVRLYKNSVETDKSLVLNKSNDWKGTFINLPYIDENGVITYSVKEDKISGYETAIEEDKNGDKFIITNSYNPETMEIDGVKTWVDESGNGIEEEVPDILITLQRTTADNWDDESKIEDVQSITLKSGETEYNFENLPKTDTNSKEYKYRVRESKVDGYEPKYNENFDIINTYTPGETEFTVNKVWNNVNVENDILPEVTAVLYQNDKVFRTEVLSKANGYRYTFTDLPEYAKTGVKYEYTVKENMNEGTVGYHTEYVDNEDGSITITNTFDITKIKVSGVKNWVGVPKGSNVPSVTLRLYQNGVEIQSITLVGGEKQNEQEAYEFNDLPRYSTDGKEYSYTVVEDTISGYTSSGEGNLSNEYTITNTFTNETITVMGEKTWKGVEDKYLSIVPTITIKLESSLDNGENWTAVEGKVIELTAGNTKYEFENLPKYASDSREYKYRVVETPLVGYTSSNNGSYNILNTYTPGETAVKVTKKWTNVDPNTNKVPEVKIILKQNGTEVNNIVLDKENGYSYTFENLDKYAPTGVEYNYEVEEILADGVEGYTKEIISGNESIIVENIFKKDAAIDITFNKVWENVSEASEVPEIKLHLYQNGVELTDKVVTLKGGLKEVREEKYEYKGLPKYSTDGKEYVYTIKEDIISGYESSGEGNALNEYTITNKFIPGTVNVTGEKTWSGVENLSIVPTITISLESSLDGEAWTAVQGKSMELTAGNTKYEFNNLPKYSSNSKEYKYRVVESEVNGYEISYDDEYNITNTYNPGEIAIRVTKKWTNVDPNNDKVPEVNIILKQDGTEVDRIVLNKENEYTHIFESLDKYAPTGVKYKYDVEEILSEGVVGYTKEIISGEEGFIVENIFDRDATIDIPFNKVWENVTDNSKVPEIKLHLYQNGVELTEKAVTLKGGTKADRIESYVFKDLPKYATEGKEYVYTVIEDAVMGYTLSGEGNDANNYTITNTFTPESIDISGKKTWRSVSEEDLRKVPAIRVFLESSTDGIIWIPVEGKVLELTVGNTEYSFNNLPKYSEQGNKYKYRVLEDAVNGYETLYDLEYNITNTYNPGERSVKVTKNWRNVDPNTDKVPEVKIILKQSGTEVDSIVLDKENEYSHIFEGLAKYAPTGEEYVYTVEEVLGDNVVGYSKVITSGNDGFIIENTFDINAVADIIFNKVWRNIPKGSEVPSIKLHLYQNGVEMVDEYGIIDNGIKEDGKDKYVFKNLPKYSTDGKEYVYTIKEDSINGYTSSGEANESNNYTIINTYDGGEKVVISGKKTWVNVKDINKVPDITLRVLRDGKEIHSIIVPSGTTTYKIDLDSMVKYASDGHEYIYSLTEDKIEGFKSESDGYNFTNTNTNTNTNTIKEEVSSISEIKTGDNNKMFLYISLLSISLSLGLIISLRKIKKTLSK